MITAMGHANAGWFALALVREGVEWGVVHINTYMCSSNFEEPHDEEGVAFGLQQPIGSVERPDGGGFGPNNGDAIHIYFDVDLFEPRQLLHKLHDDGFPVLKHAAAKLAMGFTTQKHYTAWISDWNDGTRGLNPPPTDKTVIELD